MTALHPLLRSSLVLSGLVLLAVGIGDQIAGHTKRAQYEELRRTMEPRVHRDPAALFPTASESQERYELAKAKVGFYQLLITFGQLLSALGFALIAFGVLRVRMRSLRALPDLVPRELTSRR